jgi:hypothetical protein
MPLELVGFVLDGLGKILVSYTAIAVHHRVWKEHRIDEAVFREMRREQVIGMIGLTLIITGLILEVPAYVQ